MSLVLRSIKGSELEWSELDGNFTYLEDQISGGDRFTSFAGFSLASQDLTMNSDSAWKINAVAYTNASAVVINIPYAASGMERIDLIVANTSNTFVRVAGVESASNPVAPALPANTIQATFVSVTDGAVGEPIEPALGVGYKAKQENSDVEYTLGSSEYLDAGEPSYCRIQTLTTGSLKAIRVFSIESDIYTGKVYTVKNETGAAMTIKHQDATLSGSHYKKFWFRSATDLVLEDGESAEFRYSNNRFEFKSSSMVGDVTTSTNQTVSGVKTFLDGKFGLRNIANTFTSFFTNSNTASRTYTLPDKNGTVAMISDIPKGKQIFSLTKNWTTTTLGRVYYISFNDNAIEFLSTATLHTVDESLQGRNVGMFAAPYNCKITKVTLIDDGSGSYTGKFAVASGLPNYSSTWNLAYANKVVHLEENISSAGFNVNKFDFTVSSGATIPKGYNICPSLFFSAQAQAGKTGVRIQIEIEEV